MEGAIVRERKRVKVMEEEEDSMTVQELRKRLHSERRIMATLVADLAKLKAMTVLHELDTEIFEEGQLNGWIRRTESWNHSDDETRMIQEGEQEDEDEIPTHEEQ